MAFVENSSQQIHLLDRFSNLTEREQRFLERSWSKPFAEHIFPAIDEEPFSVLYSDNPATRPNTPVNVIIGSLILKELTGLTDEEMIDELMFDIRFQYALRTTSFEEQPLSDRTLSRFRRRCLEYENETGIDLIGNCLSNLTGELVNFLGMNTTLKRMDSMMVASNIKKLSRLELIYTCIEDQIKEETKNNRTLPKELEDYLKEYQQNQVFYHDQTSREEKAEKILKDAKILLDQDGIDKNTESYQNLKRVIEEQTITEENGSLRLKEDQETKDIPSNSLQSPKDKEATYRVKGGKSHQGYVANITETVDREKDISLITHLDYDQNTRSDSSFLAAHIEKEDHKKEKETLVADGAFGGEETKRQAKKKNIRIITTDMQGRKPDLILAEFEFAEDRKTVLKCPRGYTPKNSKYYSKNDQTRITMDRERCSKCPYQDQCKPKFHKTKCSKTLSWKTTERAKQLKFMETEEYKALARFRNGVESLPSILRRKYKVDNMPVRRLLPTKFFLSFKVMAINVTNFCKGLVNIANKQEKELLVAAN